MILNQQPKSLPPRLALQRAGYAEFQDPRTGQVSYARRLRTHPYPRFHVYIDQRGDGFQITLHLDQKQPSYAGTSKHSGEYDGPVVEAEAQRVEGLFRQL